jgi:hypothetical protein
MQQRAAKQQMVLQKTAMERTLILDSYGFYDENSGYCSKHVLGLKVVPNLCDSPFARLKTTPLWENGVPRRVRSRAILP